MAQGATPVEQRRLRAELRRIRDESGRTQKVVAEALGWSISKVIRMETGAVDVSTSDLMALLSYYGIDDPGRKDALLAITRGDRKGWWEQYRSHYPQRFLNFLAYEDAAAQVRQFTGLMVPGLLQTEEYIRALWRGVMVDPARFDRGVAVRLRRQEILTRENATKAQFILDEAVLHRWVGSPDVMVGQLSHLKDMAELPNVSIRVIPFAAGVHPGMLGSFSVLELPSDVEDVDDYVVVLEDQTRDVLIRDDPEIKSKYVEIFYQLEEVACPENELHKIIDPMIDSFQKGAPQ
ncbi:MAG TPA: helix-turn-helix transcriptional regulator [Actinophytocola sp.]|uniref:helix-turn-helix domain-containing protein n=1 Tax=Actinophytocola sp. TaxID=1872138 RepID=UPI002DDC904C|nr:helix-turn-helix transcriptional regulator [Actinophytocola sp.]HEV2784562.1 helix-turn-helix transcriptional regulator [Actinophytocola sp.]